MATQKIDFEVVSPAKTDAIERRADMPPVALAPVANTSMAIMDRMAERGASLEQMREFMAFIREQEAHEAEKLYNAAMAAFKAHDIHVGKDKDNRQYNSKYTSLGNLISTVTPFLSQHRLSASWTIDQSATPAIKVTCVMKHEAGHSDSVSMVCGPDKSGAKNPIQEIKSAITYLKACTFESICGLASSDANLDDDGNGAGKVMEDLNDHLEYIANARNPEELRRLYDTAYDIAESKNNTRAMKALLEAKNAKYRELVPAAAKNTGRR